MAEVVDARGAEVPLDLAAGAVIVAEEGERRPGAAVPVPMSSLPLSTRTASRGDS